MSWTAKIKQHGAAKAKPQRKARPIVQETWAQTRRPTDDGDPGEVMPVHFTVDDGVLTVTDAKGQPLGSVKPYTLRDGDDPRRFAGVFALQAWQSNRGGDFNRPLHYDMRGIA